MTCDCVCVAVSLKHLSHSLRFVHVGGSVCALGSGNGRASGKWISSLELP